MQETNQNRIGNTKLLILYFSTWILAASSLILLVVIIWPQLYYWPYPWPETPFSYGKMIFYSVIVLMGFFLLMGIYLGKKHRQEQFNKKKKIVASLSILIFIGAMIGPMFISIPRFSDRFFDSGPYLTWATNQNPQTEISVGWHSARFTQSIVQYGTEPNMLDKTIRESNLKQVHIVSISDLSPNTIYYYKAGNSDVKSFRTAPEEESEFSFLFWADPRTNNPPYSAEKGDVLTSIMYQHAVQDGYDWDFSVCGGDIVDRGVDYQTWKMWFQDISLYDFASNKSHQVSVGNHERHDDRGGRHMNHYYPYIQDSSVQFSYAYTYANVRMIFLDRWIVDDSWFTGDDKYLADWLEQDLSNHQDVNKTLIFMHVNPAITNKHHGNNSNIMKVASQFNVSAIFSGHDHEYSTRYFNSTVFDPNTTNIINSSTGNSAVIQVGLGGNINNAGTTMYLRVNVNYDNITIQPIDINHNMLPKIMIV